MAIHVTEQLRTFLLSILLGLGAGVLYDLLRAVRLRHPRLTTPLDLLYCHAVGLAVFLFILRQSDGHDLSKQAAEKATLTVRSVLIGNGGDTAIHK